MNDPISVLLQVLAFVAGTPLAVLLFLGLAYTSYVAATTLLGRRVSTSMRWCGTIICMAWLLTTIAEITGSFSGFRLYVIIPVVALLSTLAYRAGGTTELVRIRKDFMKLVAVTRRACSHRMLLVALGTLVAIVLFRTLRGLALPPLAWDSLTYHLVKSAAWVQYGRGVMFHAPDAWSYYDYYPQGGEILWAWAMLPVSSDGLIGPAGLLMWLVCLMSAYAAARAFTSRRIAALLTAIIIAASPSVLVYLASAYVDTSGLAFYLCGIAFLVALFREPRPVYFIFLVCAFALSAASKLSSIAALGIAFMAGLFPLFRHNRTPVAVVTALAAAFLAQTGLVSYWVAWTRTGSPIYPMQLSIAGYTLLHGNEQLTTVLRGAYNLEPKNAPWGVMLYRLFGPWVPSRYSDNMNLGPGMALFVATGIFRIGAVASRKGRAVSMLLLVIAATTLSPVFGPDMRAMRVGQWWDQIGRLIIPGVAIFVLLAADVIRGKWMLRLFSLACLISILHTVPTGTRKLDGLVSLLPLFIGVAGFWVGARIWKRSAEKQRWVVCATLVILFLSTVAVIRINARPVFYYRATTLWLTRLFDPHTLLFEPDTQSPLWRDLDRKEPLKLAVCAGWKDVGHNWFVFPLLGSRLQNKWVYVPPTCDGNVENTAPPPGSRIRMKEGTCFDYQAWIKGLEKAKVDVVVSLVQPTIEQKWMESHPERFRLMSASPTGQNRAYAFMRAED